MELPIIVIACKVFENMLEKYLPPDLVNGVIFLDYGLHRIPKNLRTAVQEQVDAIKHPSLVILGYGLCGNGLDGIQAGKHILVIARTDDCIAMLLGTYDKYREQFNNQPGTYYLSKGWLESGSNPLQEYKEMLEKYGLEKSQIVMDMQYQHYKRLLFVAHNPEDLKKYRPKAIEVARFCEQWGMEYAELLGSEDYVRGLIELSVALSIGNSPIYIGDEFLVIPPGGELKQHMFMRM